MVVSAGQIGFKPRPREPIRKRRQKTKVASKGHSEKGHLMPQRPPAYLHTMQSTVQPTPGANPTTVSNNSGVVKNLPRN
jgi:hypothetical protein